MYLSENDSQILKLTNTFYNAYPNPPYIEILKKQQRAYKFTSSSRSILHKSGLDYTKIVIINRNEYIDSIDALIDHDEYVETMLNLRRIKREALEFVEDYVAHCKGERVLAPEEFRRRYRFSPLKYFHTELGL